jgi:hypothetical protein
MGTAAPSESRPYLNRDTASALVREWKDSGDSSRTFAERHSISEKTLLRWERRLRTEHQTTAITPAFVQVQHLPPCGEITVQCHGASILIPLALLEVSLPTILRAVRC